MTRLLPFLLVLLFSNQALALIKPFYPNEAVIAFVVTSKPLITLLRKEPKLTDTELVSVTVSRTGENYDAKYEVVFNYASTDAKVDCSFSGETSLKVQYDPGKNGGPPRPKGITGMTDPLFSEVTCESK